MAWSLRMNNDKPLQLTLPLVRDEEYLCDYLQKTTASSISLKLTDNSSSVLSVRKRDDAFSVRIHRIFLGAGDDVLTEIAGFIRRRRGKTPLVREFLRKNAHLLPERKPGKAFARTKGKYFDLREIFASVNGEYFGGRISSVITWGIRTSKRAVRRRTLGSYSRHSDTIRINPILDRRSVPRYFVAFVVYHEMLHADVGEPLRGGRRHLHSKEFRRRERLFREYEKAVAWEKGGK